MAYFDKSTVEFSASTLVVHKNPSLTGPEVLHTIGAVKRVQVSVAIFAPVDDVEIPVSNSFEWAYASVSVSVATISSEKESLHL